jgi:hypothetical protein
MAGAMTDKTCRIVSNTLARKLKKILFGLLISYVLIYAILSAAGSYQIFPYLLGGLGSNYRWAPAGFYNPKSGTDTLGDWNISLLLAFFPMFELDNTFVHKPEKAPQFLEQNSKE